MSRYFKTTKSKHNNTYLRDNVLVLEVYDKDVLARKHIVLLDKNDVLKIKPYTWYYEKGYIIADTIKGKIYLHKYILGTYLRVEHLNGSPLDNRRCNLRVLDKNNGYQNGLWRGVRQNNMGDWIAQIHYNHKLCHIGKFANKDRALYARYYAEKLLLGSRADEKKNTPIEKQLKEKINILVRYKISKVYGKKEFGMNYIKITENDVVNGIGIGTVLWVSGCNHHCTGCHNQNTWDETLGKEFTEETYKMLLKTLEPPHVKRLTLSGGDPMHIHNREAVLKIVKGVRKAYPDLQIWLYTGYTLESISDEDILEYIDVLVDGKFEQDKRDVRLSWCGSTNQRVINMKKTREQKNIVIWKE